MASLSRTIRKRELASFLKWIDGARQEISKSTAILSRRKTGKTALLERLYNLTFEQHDRAAPFYFQIQETNQWLGDFAYEFFLTFLGQYVAWTTRNADYLPSNKPGNVDQLRVICQTEHLDHFLNLIHNFQAVRAIPRF